MKTDSCCSATRASPGIDIEPRTDICHSAIASDAGAKAQDDVFYLHLLRALAAIAVVAIHVAVPFRDLWGQIADSQWLTAMAINSVSRWAVPVFIMVSGALLLSDPHPFDPERYVRRRVLKTVVPFIGWSLIYLAVRDFGADPWQALLSLNQQPGWYHLWFFYDFIPLYFVIPLLLPLRAWLSKGPAQTLLLCWFGLSGWELTRGGASGVPDLLLYSGYLLLGWYLFNRDNRPQLNYWLLAGSLSLAGGFFGSWWLTARDGDYNFLLMGYKGLNTALVAAMLFVLAQSQAERIRGCLRRWVLTLSSYSLGIYLLHPLLLIPIRNPDNGIYSLFGHNLLAIPVLTLLVVSASLLLARGLAALPLLRVLVPR